VPLYEYECGSCGLRFERIRKFSDPPLTACPDCGGTVSKLVSSPAFQFKGSGWYITDYAKSGQKEPSGGAAGAKDDSGKEGSKEGSAKDDSAKDAGTKTGESGQAKGTGPGRAAADKASSSKGGSETGSGSTVAAATTKPASADSKK
jgi:putative FmdB family regulatory protein